MTAVPTSPAAPVPPSGPEPPPARPLPPVGSAARDRLLVRAAALGDAGAWEQLVQDHAQRVWDLSRAAHLREEEAAAVCDIVWRQLADQLPRTDGLPLAVWLRRTATTESHLAYLRTHVSGASGERRRQDRSSAV